MKIKNIFILGVLISTSSAVLASSAPIIKTQPKSQTVNEGSSVTFSVVAENGSKDFTIPISGNVNLDMVWIEPGTFMMGSPVNELGRWGCEAQHKVTLTKGYWLGKYAVTQAQYKAIMGSNPSNFKGDNNPVDNVTWYDAVFFCEKLTAQEKKAGRLPQGYEYTLPTEAQWEYACRAGTTTALNSGKDLSDRNECPEMDELGWYGRNSDGTTHPVGQKKPNNWGLYDMHGNIYEWCLDYWEWDYPTSEVTDPTGPSTSDRRILRGGCWRYDAYDNRSACRNHHYPDQVYYSGLRVALSMVQGQSSTPADTLTYQWYKDGTAISGATASSYTIKSVKASDAGKYTVKVSNSAGSVTSSAATLTVNATVTLSSITINGSSSVNVGSTATYTCTATYSDGTTKTVTPTWSISSGTSYASITAAGVLTGKAAGTATVQAKYTEGSVTKTATKNVTVSTSTVVTKPTITTQPKSQTVTEGDSVTFSVTATGTAPLSYQWKKNGSNISGATSSSYKINSAKTSDAGSYTVTVSNSAGSVTSSTATLTVNASVVLPKIITQPKSQTVNEGESVTFSVVAEGGSSSGNADFSVPLSSSVNLDMVWINPGTFMMGSPENEPARATDEIQHQVTLTKGYWLGKYEITQTQYEVIMGTNPSYFSGNNNPVERVSWYDAMNFCAELTVQERAMGRLPEGYEYTLPTEAQWEYACRAKTTTAFNNGTDLPAGDDIFGPCSNLDSIAWYYYNSDGKTHPVGQKQPNAWGLYDMSGNVEEWCLDWYGDYPTSAVTDPVGPSTGSDCVLRGGCWHFYPDGCRSADRYDIRPSWGDGSDNGFRVALVPVQPQASAAASDTLTYQWYKDGKAISGATGSSYTIVNVKASDAGKYTVKVCNSAGCVTSEIATLTVNVPVTLSSITINGSSSVNVGSTATYTCTATYSNGTTKTVTPTWAISAGSSYASITSAGILTGKAAGTATIQAKYTDGGVTKTATKNITVNAVVVKPSITTQPKSQTVNEGSSVTFSVTASGTTPLSYQWYKGSSKISGATSASYKISSVKTSDEGSYKVTVSNSAGSVTSSVVTLTVNSTTPTNPNGTAVRSVKRSGKSATVTLKLEPDADVSVMFVEEHVPSGVSISVNDGGTYVASRNMIRWSFLDGNAREISYVLTVADSFDGKVSLSGEVTFDETTVTVTGTSEIDFAILTHPADMNDDFEISTKEISSYALAWTKAQSWSREPADIPVTYVSRAAIIWVNGGYYDYDPGKSEPSCWVSTNVKPASVELAADSVNVRTINVLEGKADVSLEVIPSEGISVYFVEEQLPTGMKVNVTNISDNGRYVEARGLIRWSFLDAEPRTLTYTIEPEAGFDGLITVNGEVTFDEETFTTEGDIEANFGGGADVPQISAAYFGGMLIEGTIGGTYVIEYSEDGINWFKADEITLTASSMYWADLTSANSPKRLYRAKVK